MEQRQPGASNATGRLKKPLHSIWQATGRERQKCHNYMAKAGSRGHCALGKGSIHPLGALCYLPHPRDHAAQSQVVKFAINLRQ